MLGGVAKIIFHTNGLFEELIVGSYLILFGLVNALLEFQIPPYVARYASFYFSFVGRGIRKSTHCSALGRERATDVYDPLVYTFLGSITLDAHWAGYTTGAVIGIVGVAYIVLEFLPQIEPPANMREADAGWGAEQV